MAATQDVAPSTEPKFRIGVSVAGEAGNQWQDFAEQSGVSITSLIEAFGPFLAHDVGGGVLDMVVRDARRLDATKRRRC